MKSVRQTGIWIDTSKAILVTLHEGGENISTVNSVIENSIYHDHGGNKGTFMGRQHLNDERKFEERRKHQVGDFLDEVLQQAKDSDELYVFGPAGMKNELSKVVNTNKLNPKVKLRAVETADKMSLNKIVAKVKKFYLH